MRFHPWPVVHTDDDFIGFTGYSVRGFWDVVEKFWNRDLFEKVNGVWTMKDEGYNDLVGV